MNCDNVCIGGADLDCMDGPSANIITTPKSRKVHKCCECRREIPVGDFYERQVAIFDGTARTYKTCLLCTEIRDAFCCEGYLFGELISSIRTELLPVMTTRCLDKLTTTEAKQFLRDMWQSARGLA